MKYLLFVFLSFAAFGQSAKLGMINKTVTTAGTPERLSADDLYVRMVEMQAASDNTGLIFVGTSSAGAAAGNGITLTKGSATISAGVLQIGESNNNSQIRVNLKDIWVNSATNGDQVNALYIE